MKNKSAEVRNAFPEKQTSHGGPKGHAGWGGYCAQHQSKQRFGSKAAAKAHLKTRDKEFQESIKIYRCKTCKGYHFSKMDRERARDIDSTAKSRRYGIKNWRAFEELIPEKERLENIGRRRPGHMQNRGAA